eukprot:3111766-Alexandrium_andersonii.AAC.1
MAEVGRLGELPVLPGAGSSWGGANLGVGYELVGSQELLENLLVGTSQSVVALGEHKADRWPSAR